MWDGEKLLVVYTHVMNRCGEHTPVQGFVVARYK